MPNCHQKVFSRKNSKIKSKEEISNMPEGCTKIYINPQKDKFNIITYKVY